MLGWDYLNKEAIPIYAIDRRHKKILYFDDGFEHHGIKGQKWGVITRNVGVNYIPIGKRKDYATKLANEIHSTAKKKEPKITKAITSAAKSCQAKMYGLEHRLKTKESILRKIKTDSVEKDISLAEAAQIKDAVRYTVISNENNFVNNYKYIKNFLEEKGYKESRCKNYFELYKQGMVKHKSVQSVFKDKDGYPFEVQFQTPASQKAKDLKVPIYEERRQLGLSVQRQRELEQQMVDLAEAVPYPPGINNIKTH